MYRYRTLEAWKRAHELAIGLLRATDVPHHPRTRNVFDQLRRATISIEANIVEGYALGSVGNYLRHLRIALGSAAEAECLLKIAAELRYLNEPDVARFEELLGGTMRALSGLIRKHRAPISA